MKYVNANGKQMSIFTLGTVQLGMDYGLGEHRKKPSEEKAFSILDTAMENGIDNLDTANNYADSDVIIGRWLQKRKAEKKALPFVVTKIGPLKHGSRDILRDDILYQTEGCLKALGTDTLDCLMLHNFEDYEQDADEISKVFNDLKSQGVCTNTALSVYSRHDYNLVAQSGFDGVQIPLNVFDWEKIENGEIEKIAKASMSIFVRSVFLQGLVFKKPEDLSEGMSFCAPYLKKYLELCREWSLAPDVLALSFVLSVPGITTTVMGCDTEAQVIANCNLFDKTVTLSQNQLDALREAFSGIDKRVINPGAWNK
jgi:aryl-alcohol dehydrogenase-like predicted oxidoreductase